MTASEHAAEAERLLGTLSRYSGSRDFPPDEKGKANAIAQAQVHATLALIEMTKRSV